MHTLKLTIAAASLLLAASSYAAPPSFQRIMLAEADTSSFNEGGFTDVEEGPRKSVRDFAEYQQSTPLTLADGYLEGVAHATLELSKGKTDGRQWRRGYVKQTHAPGFMSGMLAGFIGGPIGAGLAWGLTQGDEPDHKTLGAYRDHGSDFQQGFKEGYKATYQKAKKLQRLGGGLVGSAISAGILYYFAAVR